MLVRPLVLASLSCLALACGGSQKAKPAPGPTCDAVAVHTADIMRQTATSHGVDLGGLPEVVHQVVAERCTADAWSEAARACLVAADDQGLPACSDQHLTEAQNRALEHAMEDQVKASPDFRRMLETMHGVEPAPDTEPTRSRGLPPSDPCGGDE